MPADVVGPVCETGDFLALDRELPGSSAGDRLAMLGAGAYGFVMARTTTPVPGPRKSWWMAAAGGWRGARETVEDLFRTEKVTP